MQRNVVWAGIVSFFMDVSSEMIYSLVPVFLTSVLGVNKSIIGLIEGIAEATASLLKLFSGWLSDKLRRRKILMLAGYSLSALSRPVLALSFSWWTVLAARFVDRSGKGIRTAPRDALIAESVLSDYRNKHRMGLSFGFHRAMDQLGAAVGPLIAFLILWARPGDFRTVFWVSVIPALFSALVIIIFIREGRKKFLDQPQDQVNSEAGTDGKSALKVSKAFWAFLSATALFALGNSSDVFLILRGKELGLAVTLVPVIYLVFNLVYSLVSLPAGLVADRVGRKKVALMGFALFAGTYLWMAFATTVPAVWGVFVLYGIYMGVSDGNYRALVADLGLKEKHGTSFGLYHGVVGACTLLASVIAGLLYDLVGPGVVFILGAVAATVAGLVMLVFMPDNKAAPLLKQPE